jgi:hypothetical protein
MISDYLRRQLVNDTISQPNKLHIVIGHRSRGHYIEWRWAGEELRSRMSLQFEQDGPWYEVKSFEFDVRPKLKWAKEIKQ